jgi:hypothetical protein
LLEGFHPSPEVRGGKRNYFFSRFLYFGFQCAAKNKEEGLLKLCTLYRWYIRALVIYLAIFGDEKTLK